MMPAIGRQRHLADLTFEDVARRVAAQSVLILPVGSIEQHGPHLPLNTDVLIAEALADRIVERWADTFDLWRLPTISMGLAREHEWAAGTLSLSVPGMTGLLHDLARTIRRTLPTRHLLVLNCHGGNRGILEALSRDLAIDHGLNVCIFHPAALTDGVGPVPDLHAGRNETSIMLAVAPHLVRLDRIPEEQPDVDAGSIRDTVLDLAVTWPWSSRDDRLSRSGVIGDPRGATAEFGQSIIGQAVERAGEIIARLTCAGRDPPVRC
jgi:creatinine amidohydrolase/Fe(II)-dependent formamide hydrolase-like protein